MAWFTVVYEDEKFMHQAVAQIPRGHTALILDKISVGTICNWDNENTIE